MTLVECWYFYVAGPFTRPHPAIWRIVFGQYFSENSTRRKNTSILLSYYDLLCCFSHFLFIFRPECPLLPIPGFYHLPQLAAGKATHVLVGSKPALRKERGRHNGEYDHKKHAFLRPERPHDGLCAPLYRSMLWTVMPSPGRESWATLTFLPSVISGVGVWRPCSSEAMASVGPSVLPGSSPR